MRQLCNLLPRRPVGGLRFLIAALGLTLGALSFGTDYYVSVNGSDTNAGTFVSPFKTIQKAALLAGQGDQVIIRGGTYRETVTPAKSGIATSPVTYKPFGTETVIVSGADPIGGWTKVGSDWQAPNTTPLTPGQNQLFVDGAGCTDARWPNAPWSASRPNWSKFASVASVPFGNGALITITDPALTQATGYWIGARINFLSGIIGYAVQTGTVTLSSPGTLTFQTTRNIYTPILGNSYYLVGSMAQDAPNEWYQGTNVAVLRPPFNDDVVNHNIEIKRRKYGFDLSGRQSVNIQGIQLFATAIKSDASTSGCDINNVRAKYVSHSMFLFDTWNDGGQGIELSGNNNVFRNSVIEYSSGNGVRLQGSSNVVSNCLIHDVNYAGGDEAGVYLTGSSHRVTNNTIYNFGRSGVHHSVCLNAKILNNDIYYGSLQSNDCGGTYCWVTDGGGTEIAYNIVHEMITGGNGGNGIFIDDDSSNFLIHHNLTYNVDYGYHQNPFGQNTSVFNNTWIGSRASVYFDNRGSLFSNVSFFNNILTFDLWQPPVGSGITLSNNTLQTGDPKFVAPDLGNYQLQAGSPAIDTGKVFSPYTDGYTGSAPDQGAYEYGKAPWVAGASLSIAPPPAPTGLTGTPGLGRVFLTWKGRAEATTYNLYRSTQSGGPYLLVAPNLSGTSGYDTTATPNTNYYYVLSSLNANGESSTGSEVKSFAYASIQLNGLVGTYFQGVKLYDNNNGIIYSAPLLQRLDGNIDFNWGYGSPDPVVPVDNFSAIWNGYLTAPVDGTYTFTVKTDNGCMLIIDDKVVISQLSNVIGTFTGTIDLKAAIKHRIRIEYFEFDTTAQLHLSWAYPGQTVTVVPTTALTPPAGIGVEGNYYNDTPTTFGAFGTYVGTRTDGELNCWALGSLYPGGNATYYSVKWKGTLMAPVDGAYTLNVTSDDGQRLIVDGVKVIDNLVPNGRQINNAYFNWTAGSMHTVEVQMANGLSWGGATLAWAFPGQALQNIPQKYLYGPLMSDVNGLFGIYYSDFSGTAPSFTYQQSTRVDDNVNFGWTGISPGINMPTDYYSVRWDGQILPPTTATYKFTLKYDGGVRLWVNGKLVIDSFTQMGGATAISNPMTLYSGQKYNIRIEYQHRTGPANIQLLWQNDSPSGGIAIVPKSALTKTSDLGG